jgi:hypothetical protein
MAEFESSQGGVSHIATWAQVLRIVRYCEMQSHAATLHGESAMTPRELRATLDCLDLSAAEAGHLRATVYRWLDGSTSVPIVVELLLRLMVRRGIRPTEVTASRHGRTSAKPRSGRSQAKSAKRIVHPNTRAKSKQDAVLALLSRPRGAAIAAMMQATGWQSHSVCGFLAGVVRKKLGLTLQSDKTEGERVYRVIRTGETALAYSPTVGAAQPSGNPA